MKKKKRTAVKTYTLTKRKLRNLVSKAVYIAVAKDDEDPYAWDEVDLDNLVQSVVRECVP